MGKVSKAKIIIGDVLNGIKDIETASVQTVITSPPYWGLRDYGQEDQLGLEETPEQYVANMVQVFSAVKRILKDDGTVWLNIGDSYSGSGKRPAGNLGKTHDERNMEHKHSAIVPDGLKPKDLVGIPWRLAFALQSDGWYLRQDIIWHKPNPMPESVTDRCTKSHEYVFLLSKSRTYYFDNEAIKEPSTGKSGTWSQKTHEARLGHGAFNKEYVPSEDGLRNKRDVWSVATKPFKGAHFAVMPEALVEPCVLAGSAIGDTVFDPFTGSGTVAVVALRNERNFIGTELNPDYAEIANNRIFNDAPLLNKIEKINNV